MPPAPSRIAAGPDLASVYDALSQVSDLLLSSQTRGMVRSIVLHRDSLRPNRTIALSGYLFEATLSRTWPARTLATDDGAMIVMEAEPNEFYIAGSGLSVSFARDPDMDNKIGGIVSIEEISRLNGAWVTLRRLNGDQTNQGRQLQMDPHQMRIYRVKLYATERSGAAI